MMGSDFFSSDTLASLTSTQTDGNSTDGSSTLDSAANDLASSLIDQFGSNGQLSLSDIETAMGSSADATSGSTASESTTGTDGGVASAFSALDANGDGELSSSELAKGLESMFASAMQAGPFGPPPAPPPDSASGSADSSQQASNSTDSSSSSGGSSASAKSADVEAALERILLQYAQAQYGALSAGASQIQSSVNA